MGKDPILVHNVDIITDIDLMDLQSFHINNNNIATLCVRNRQTSRYLLFDEQMLLSGWTNKTSDQLKLVSGVNKPMVEKAFSGVYIIDPEFLDKIPFEGKFSIIDALLNIASKNRIMGYETRQGNWFDLGTEDRIRSAEKRIK